MNFRDDKGFWMTNVITYVTYMHVPFIKFGISNAFRDMP